MKQILKAKCPHCGWIRRIDLDVEAGRTEVVAGIADFFKGLSQAWQDKIKPLLEGRRESESSHWLPLPACPNCNKEYEYNVVTKETR